MCFFFFSFFFFLIKLENESSNVRLVDERYLTSLTSEEAREQLSTTDLETLYCEIIYTIKHKIGRTIDGHNDYILDLYKYAQEAFKMSQHDHERLFAQTCEEKVNKIKNCKLKIL